MKAKLKRTAAQYKSQFGVAKTLEENMLSEIRSTYFSLNLDEATSSNHHRVLSTVLVSYFNQGKKEVVCEHLASINVPAVTTENIFNTLINFKEKSVPSKNLLATLMESCNVMR